MPSLTMPLARAAVLGLVLAALLAVFAPARGHAQVDPAGCTDEVGYDPAIPTYESVVGRPLGDGPTGSSGRDMSADIYKYFDAVLAAAESSTRVRMLKKPYGTSVLGKPMQFYVISSPSNIANLDGGRRDAAFWAGVRDGTVSEAAGLAAVRSRPAPAWITSTPHGAEPAAGEAIARNLYELAARTDCWNAQRLRDMDFFLLPVRNPDGRDVIQRTSAWTFDHNRDFGTQNQIENGAFLPLFKQYPGVFFIDAHQTGNGYFFPPNEDPVHHEISDFTVDFIGDLIGPAIRQAFNDQSIDYFNYDTYDLFVPEYGDTVPSLLSGAAGMTFEKGTSEVYGKQVYEHYLAIDATIDVTARNKPAILTGWVRQWAEAVRQGEGCDLEPNELVSPLTEPLKQQPAYEVCGYFFRPDRHEGDMAALVRHMQAQGVHVYRFQHDVNTNGVREYGTGVSNTEVLPKGTLYMPMSQPLKHWIQAVMGEDPFEPIEFFYDVATWSYPMHRGLAGSGFLTSQLPPGVVMTEIGDPALGTLTGAGSPVYAFETDSMQALALVWELLERKVDVYRGRAPFSASGRNFTTGTALVDGASLAARGVDLAALAAKRQTPVTGVNGYPVEHQAMERPKVGVYTQANITPNSPLHPNEALNTPEDPRAGHCAEQGPGVGSAADYCVALFTLTQKADLPGYADEDVVADAMLSTIDASELAAGDLVAKGYTVLLNPNQPIAAGAGAAALQAFVNQGGTYVGTLANGTNAARNAGLTTIATVTSGSLSEPGATFSTPGSTFTGTFDTASPVAWGFDDDGFIYRDATSNLIYNKATLDADARAAVSYAEPLRSLGFSRSATGPGKLDGRPAVIDEPFGAGRAVMFGHNAFYRSWKEADERLVLNALLYPRTPVRPAATVQQQAQQQQQQQQQTAAPVTAAPLAKAELPKVTSRPLRKARGDRDVRIQVARKHKAELKRAVRAAKLPKATRKKVRYVRSGRTLTLVVKGARTSANDHERGEWVRRIVGRLDRRDVKILFAQL
jgi:hypothetical protein